MPDISSVFGGAKEARVLPGGSIPRNTVLGVDVSAVTLARAGDEVEAWIRSKQRSYVCVSGVHGVMECQRDEVLRKIHNSAGLVVPDGMPLVWISQKRGFKNVSRVYGPDLMLELCARSLKSGASHFLYGGADGVPELLADRLKERFPGIRIAGTFSPPFRPLGDVEASDVARRINASGADMVWVGLSTPKQERWMARFRLVLTAPALLGVGAAFDFHAGLKPQAPSWIQKAGMEWLFRALSEPRRLGPRYLQNNPAFVVKLVMEELRLRRERGGLEGAGTPLVEGAKNPLVEVAGTPLVARRSWDRRKVPDSRRPGILAFAYSAEPGKGSEPGAGWGMLRALARLGDVTALVKSEHMPAIRAWEREHRTPSLKFVEVRPRVIRPIQKLHRITEFLTYLDWLRQAKKAAQELVATGSFDVAQHLTYSVYWLPSPVTELGLPSIWGPVAGGVAAPRVLWRRLGILGLLDELLDHVAVGFCARLAATRRTWSRATVRVVQNEGTRDRLPEHLRPGTLIQNAAVYTDVASPPVSGRQPVVVFPSSLVSRKCPRLALEAVAHAPSVRLQFAHTGRQEAVLKALAVELGIADRVDFLGRIPRTELFERLAQASAAVFTGIREEGGLALAEAMRLGTPVVVLGVGGASTIARAATDDTRVRIVAPSQGSRAARQIGEAMDHFVRNPAASHAPNLDHAVLDEFLAKILDAALDWRIARPADDLTGDDLAADDLARADRPLAPATQAVPSVAGAVASAAQDVSAGTSPSIATPTIATPTRGGRS